MPGGPGGPADRVDPGVLHGSAAGQVRGAGVEPVGTADQHPGAERRVELVPGEGEVVDVVRGDVDPPVRRQLGGVDDDPGAVFVGQGGQCPDRQDLTGDVGGAGDGEQADAAVGEFPTEQFQRGGEGGGGDDAAVRHALPRQQVGVVFDVEVEHFAGVHAVDDGQAAGQQVQGIGGVPGEDHRIVRAAAHEIADNGAGVLVDRGADLGGVAGAAVDAGVERQDLVEVGRDDGQRRGRGAVVQVRVADVAALDERRLDLGAGHCGQRPAGDGEPRLGAGLGGGGWRSGLAGMVAVVMGPRSKRTPHTGDPRLPGPFRTGQVVTRGTPPRMEGCRPANRGFALALVTCFEPRTFPFRRKERAECEAVCYARQVAAGAAIPAGGRIRSWKVEQLPGHPAPGPRVPPQTGAAGSGAVSSVASAGSTAGPAGFPLTAVLRLSAWTLRPYSASSAAV